MINSKIRDFLYVFLVSGMMLILVVIERVAIFVTNTATKSIIVDVIKENWSSFFY
jgi:uncharacterized membrane-anchored protein